ncbi:MAG: thioredoxin [Erysipelotrichia bacterium]|nr:thioredoxin [Erysipelotrichia bacterium]
MIKVITKENFHEEIENAAIPAVVELWAPWCAYCRRLSPVLDRVDAQYGEKLIIGKINIDEQPELADSLDDSTIPTLYVYRNGKHGEKLVAPSSQDQLEEWLKSNQAI